MQKRINTFKLNNKKLMDQLKSVHVSSLFLKAVLRFQKLDKLGIRKSDIISPEMEYVKGYVQAKATIKAMEKSGCFDDQVKQWSKEIREMYCNFRPFAQSANKW